MRISDLTRIAVKNLKGRWVLLPILGLAISTFCFCYAGAVITTMAEEKAQPYEFSVMSGSTDVTDYAVLQISELENVEAVTSVLEVPVSVAIGDYTAQLMLVGIDSDYLREVLSQGEMFPDSSAMPYIVLNEAVLEQFKIESSNTAIDMETDNTDWPSESVSITTSEGMRPVVSKISGILMKIDEQEQEPVAYISLSVAKHLLQQSGMKADYTRMSVRVKNIGSADNVSKSVAELGLMVSNNNDELQRKWDMETKEMTYLIVIGAFCLLCSAVLMMAWRKISMLEQKEALSMLRWIGMRNKQIIGIYMIQSLMIASFGVAIGVIVSVSLPSFLSPKMTEVTIFTLAIPLETLALSAAICIAACIVPLLNFKKMLQQILNI